MVLRGFSLGVETVKDIFDGLFFFVVSRVNGDQDIAAANFLFKKFRFMFGNARADQTADQAARRGARAKTGEGCYDRAGNDQVEARDRDRACARDKAGNRAQHAAQARARCDAFLGFRAFVEFEMLAARFVGHHDADLVRRDARRFQRVDGLRCGGIISENG